MRDFWNKIKQPLLFLAIVFFVGGFGSLVIQRHIAPFLSAQPGFRSISFLRPDSPLVITRTEQIRINENVNVRNLIKQANPKVVTVIAGAGEIGRNFQESQRQAGVILSSDGVIATDKNIFIERLSSYVVVMSDGKVLPATFLADDPKSNLALIRVEDSGLSAASFGTSQDLELGQQVIVLSGSDRTSATQFKMAYVTSVFRDSNFANVYSSESYPQTFSIDIVPPAGAAVFNLSGQLVGVGTGEAVTASEAVRSAQDSYFADRDIKRAYLGISYSIFGRAGSQIMGLPVEDGVILRSTSRQPAVVAGSPAGRAGLLEGDIIIRINGESVSLSQPLSNYLNRSKPGDVWKLTVLRSGRELELPLTLGVL